MPRIGLSTFMKISLLSDEQKEKQYAQYLEPGGFDYYRDLHEALEMVTWKKREIGIGLAYLQKIKNISRRKNSIAAFERFCAIYIDKDYFFVEPPRGQLSSPQNKLTVKVRPITAIKTENAIAVISIWSTKKPQLSPRAAAVGLNLMFRCIGTRYDGHAVTCGIVDLCKGVTAWGEAETKRGLMAVASEFAIAGAFFEETGPAEEAAA